MRHDHVLTTWSLVGLLMASARPVWAAKVPPPKAPEPFHYNAGDHRDPFVSLIEGGLANSTDKKPPEPSKPILYGVLWDAGGHSIALINDTDRKSEQEALPVKVGDMVGDYRVLEIRHDSVVLGNGGEPMVLGMSFGPPVSKRSSGASTGASTGGEGH